MYLIYFMHDAFPWLHPNGPYNGIASSKYYSTYQPLIGFDERHGHVQLYNDTTGASIGQNLFLEDQWWRHLFYFRTFGAFLQVWRKCDVFWDCDQYYYQHGCSSNKRAWDADSLEGMAWKGGTECIIVNIIIQGSVKFLSKKLMLCENNMLQGKYNYVCRNVVSWKGFWVSLVLGDRVGQS